MKKLLGLLIVSMFFCSPAQAYFADVDETQPWFTSVSFLQHLGYIQGYTTPDQGEFFGPERTINRAELLKMGMTAFALPHSQTQKNCFTDVTTQWFAPYICTAKKMNLVQGFQDGTFRPDQPVTHAEGLKILLTIASFQDDIKKITDGTLPYQDVKSSDWFHPYFVIASKRQILSSSATYIFPQALLHRGDAAEYLYRAMMIRLTKYPLYDEAKALEFIEKNTGLDLRQVSVSTVQPSVYEEIKNLLKTSHPMGATITEEDFTTATLKGLSGAAHDPYTDYFPKKEADDYMNTLEGELQGIGVEIEATKTGLLLMTVFPGTPAEKSGLMPGDTIYSVEGETLKTLTPTQMISKIKGTPGTSVTLEVYPRESETLKKLTITRELIIIPSAYSKPVPNATDLGYIKINQFNSKTADTILSLLETFDKEQKKGVILDLRGNGGGLLDSAIYILSLFHTPGTFVGSAETENNVLERFTTYDIGYIWKKPVVILIDKYSASASEVMAAGLSETLSIPLVGEKSFGKGAVQQLFTLSDGSELKMTIAYLYTPKHNNVGKTMDDRKGLVPDVAVLDNPSTTQDEQIESAISTLRAKIVTP